MRNGYGKLKGLGLVGFLHGFLESKGAPIDTEACWHMVILILLFLHLFSPDDCG
jgi:hypothetical protein